MKHPHHHQTMLHQGQKFEDNLGIHSGEDPLQ